MKALYSFFAVIILIGIAYLGITADMTTFFGVFLPYIAAATCIFAGGFILSLIIQKYENEPERWSQNCVW